MGTLAHYLGTDNGEVMLFDSAYAADAGSNITTQIVTKRIDFIDQYPDLLDKMTTIQGVKLIYVDNGAFSVTVSVSIDEKANYTDSTQTIGTAGAPGTIKSKTFNFNVAGQFFNFKVTYTAATGVLQIVELMVMLNESGEHMET